MTGWSSSPGRGHGCRLGAKQVQGGDFRKKVINLKCIVHIVRNGQKENGLPHKGVSFLPLEMYVQAYAGKPLHGDAK